MGFSLNVQGMVLGLWRLSSRVPWTFYNPGIGWWRTQVGETGMLPNSAKIFVVKVDQSGRLLWQKEFGNTGHNLGNSMIETSDAYWVVGSQGQDSALIKLDKVSGDTLIEKKYDLGGSDAIEAMIQTPTGFVGVGYHSADDPNNTFFTGGQGLVVFLISQVISYRKRGMSISIWLTLIELKPLIIHISFLG